MRTTILTLTALALATPLVAQDGEAKTKAKKPTAKLWQVELKGIGG